MFPCFQHNSVLLWSHKTISLWPFHFVCLLPPECLPNVLAPVLTFCDPRAVGYLDDLLLKERSAQTMSDNVKWTGGSGVQLWSLLFILLEDSHDRCQPDRLWKSPTHLAQKNLIFLLTFRSSRQFGCSYNAAPLNYRAHLIRMQLEITTVVVYINHQ